MTILLLGGGSSFVLDYIADARDSVKIVVPKGDRQKAALGTLKDMKKSTRAYQKYLKKAGKELYEVIDKPDDVESELDAVWNSHFTEVQLQNTKMLDLRFELKEQLTREEWGEIFSNDHSE